MNERDVGGAFLAEIMSTHKANGGRNWSWERYVNGPVNDSFVDTVCSIAGCWCENSNASSVRFYTNNGHGRWSGMPSVGSSNPWR